MFLGGKSVENFAEAENGGEECRQLGARVSLKSLYRIGVIPEGLFNGGVECIEVFFLINGLFI